MQPFKQALSDIPIKPISLHLNLMTTSQTAKREYFSVQTATVQ